MGFSLPDGDGAQIATELSRKSQRPKILVLTARRDEATLFNLRKLQIEGLIWKATGAIEWLKTGILKIMEGGTFYPPEVQQAQHAFRKDPHAFFKILSDREIELLPLLALGETNSEIATQMAISPKTVKSHREHIMSKLGIHNAVKLMRWASERGFGRWSYAVNQVFRLNERELLFVERPNDVSDPTSEKRRLMCATSTPDVGHRVRDVIDEHCGI